MVTREGTAFRKITGFFSCFFMIQKRFMKYIILPSVNCIISDPLWYAQLDWFMLPTPQHAHVYALAWRKKKLTLAIITYRNFRTLWVNWSVLLLMRACHDRIGSCTSSTCCPPPPPQPSTCIVRSIYQVGHVTYYNDMICLSVYHVPEVNKAKTWRLTTILTYCSRTTTGRKSVAPRSMLTRA